MGRNKRRGSHCQGRLVERPCESQVRLPHDEVEVAGRLELMFSDPLRRSGRHDLLLGELLPLLGTSTELGGGVEGLCRRELSSRTGASRT